MTERRTLSSIWSDQSPIVKEDEIHDDFETNITLDDTLPYLDEIRKFKNLCKKKSVDLKPSWSGMNIPETTTDQLDMQIQADRIMLIFERVLEKLEIVGYMHEFLKDNGAILNKYLDPTDADFITEIAYDRMKPYSSRSTASDRKRYRTIVGGVFDLELEQLLQIVTTNKCLEKYINKRKLHMDPFVKDMIEAIKKFMKIIQVKLKITAAEEREREVLLKSAFIDYKDRMLTIGRLEEKLQQQVQNMVVKLENKEIMISQCSIKCEEIAVKVKSKLSEMVLSSEKEMMKTSDASELRQITQAEQAKIVSEKYQKLLEGHLFDEKRLRSRKIKIETQLASWIAKFDQDVGERQAELDDIIAAHDADAAEIADLEALIAEQDKVYDVYKAEKDAEDEEIFNERLYIFVANRAARRIQQCWRAHKARKLARKKAKKAKAAARAAAKAAKRK